MSLARMNMISPYKAGAVSVPWSYKYFVDKVRRKFRRNGASSHLKARNWERLPRHACRSMWKARIALRALGYLTLQTSVLHNEEGGVSLNHRIQTGNGLLCNN